MKRAQRETKKKKSNKNFFKYINSDNALIQV